MIRLDRIEKSEVCCSFPDTFAKGFFALLLELTVREKSSATVNLHRIDSECEQTMVLAANINLKNVH